MFPRRFPNGIALTVLISALALLSSAIGYVDAAQVYPVQPPADRVESPTERRLRAQLVQDRKIPIHWATVFGEANQKKRSAGNGLDDQHSNAPPVQDSVRNIEFEIVPTSNGYEQLGVSELETPIESPGLEEATRWSDRPHPDQAIAESDWQPPSKRELDSLESFEQLAIENHPTLNAAVARILSARHEALQAGLHPNPQLGLYIDELGNENDPGLWGSYLQWYVVRGNKLAIGRKAKNREAGVLEIEFETQIMRIQTDVRTAFYRLLIAQEKHQLARQLYQAQQDAVSKSQLLFDAGETPKTDLLQTQLQADKAMVLRNDTDIRKENAWRALATVVGEPGLPLRPITGSFEPIAETISFDDCLEQILTNSPEFLAAKAEVERIRSTVEQEIAKSIPNYQTQVSLGRDSNSNHFFTGVQLQVPLQVYNRNQGNIAAAKSRLVVAQSNVEKIRLELSKRLATEFQLYQSAVVKSDLYASRLLPNAQETLDLLASGYPEEVSFVRLLTAQQTVIDITIEYLSSIEQGWISRLKIEGLLLDDSLSQ